MVKRVAEVWGTLKRMYAAAKNGGSIGYWRPQDADVNTEIFSSQAQVNARVRQLVRDMPHAARAIEVLATAIVGPGLTLQSRIRGSDGTLDKKLNQKIEDGWKWWTDEADLAGRLHLDDLQALAVRQLVEIGEFVFIKTATASPGRYLPLAIRMVEADQLGPLAAVPLPGNAEFNGIEFDPRTGKTQAYWFTNDASVIVNNQARLPIAPVRLSAHRVLHGFQSLRPGQLRGISPFAPAVLLAHSLRDYLEAEIDGARMAARWLAFIETSDPTATMGAFGVKTDSTLNRKVEEVGTAIKEYLLPNEKVTIAQHNRPGDAFTPFTRFVLQTFGAVIGVPYELLSGNYDGLNYSVLRGVRNDFQQAIDTLRARFIRQFCQPLQREFLTWAVLTGKLALPGYLENPYPYLRSVWLGPGRLAVDPLKEGRADLDAIGGLLRSPQETILDRGRDPEEVLDELAEWKQLLADRDLEPAEATSPLKSNPAAVAQQGTDDEEDDPPAPGRKWRIL